MYKPSPLPLPHVEVIEEKTVHDAFMQVKTYTLRIRQFDGSVSPVFPREVARFGKTGLAAVALPYHAPTDSVVLIEQFRIVHFLNHRPNCWQLEAIAGLIEPGEDKETAIRREISEESGCIPQDLIYLGRLASSPGGYLEQMELFIARCEPPVHGSLVGLASEHEDIRVHVLPFSEALELADNSTIEDSKTVLLLNRLAREREKLRKLWT